MPIRNSGRTIIEEDRRHPPTLLPQWKSIQPPDVESARRRDVPLCLIARRGTQKGSFEGSTVTIRGRAPFPLKESLLSNGKKINTDILTSRQNSYGGFCWIFPPPKKQQKKHAPCVSSIYIEMSFPLLRVRVCWIHTPNVCILLIFAVRGVSAPLHRDSVLASRCGKHIAAMIAHAFQRVPNITEEPRRSYSLPLRPAPTHGPLLPHFQPRHSAHMIANTRNGSGSRGPAEVPH